MTGGRFREIGAAVLLAVACCAAVAPTLTWLEFTSGSENLVVGAVTEMRRTGDGGMRLVPTLNGEPRVKKPPLPTWAAAAPVDDATMRGIATPDRQSRDAAFRRLAWQVRSTGLLASGLLLVATYALGRLVAGHRVGLVAIAACASSVMFLRFGRVATPDVHLALWVTVANACLAAAVFRGRTWAGLVGGGAALGLAFMSKGPVALLQTLLPFGLFLLWRSWDARRRAGDPQLTPPADDPENASRTPAPVWLPAIVGLLAFLAITLPWPIAVVAQRPDVWAEWRSEISREGATDLPPDPWYVYLVIFGWVLPWVAWFIAGVVLGVTRLFGAAPGGDRSAAGRTPAGFPVAAEQWEADEPPAAAGRAVGGLPAPAVVLSLLLVFVPVLVMSLLKDKNERYLFPVVSAAAVLIAQALVGWIESGRPREKGVMVVLWVQRLTLAVIAVGAPVAAATVFRRLDGHPYLTPAAAGAATAVGALIVLASFLLDRRRPYMQVAAGAALVLFMQYPLLWGYADSADGRAEFKPLADLVWSVSPDADVYELDVPGRTRVYSDLPIYLNRIVRKTSHPDALPPIDRPVALAWFARRALPEPTLPPPWRFAGQGGSGKSVWKLYVRPSAN